MLLSYYKRPIFIILIFYILLSILYFNFFSKNTLDIEEKEFYFCGTVKTYPEEVRRKTKFEFISETPFKNQRFIVYIKKSNSVSYMDYICFNGLVRKPYFYSIPGNFSWAKYLANKGIFYEITAEGIMKIKKAGFPYNIATKIREKIMDFIDENFKNDDENGVISGITLGQKKKISSKLKLEFQNSGAMHLLVASGSNVGFLMGMFSFFFIKILRIYKRKALILGLLCSGFYVIAAGLDPPLTRAYIMTVLATLFFIIERKTDLFQILILSAFLILIFSPRSIFDPGFQMSFLAVYGIIIGVSLWYEHLKLKNKLLSYILNLLFVTIFAQIALFPLLLTYFYKFSIISFISNMFLVPFSGLIMYLVFFSAIFEKIGISIFIYILKIVVNIFIKAVHFFGSFKYSAIYLPELNLWGYLFLIIFLFLLLHLPLFGIKNKKIIFITSFSFLLFIFSFFIPPKDFSLYFYSCKGIKSGVISLSGKLIILNPCDEKIINTILYSGYKKVKAVLITEKKAFKPEVIQEISEAIQIETVYIPFWIGDQSNIKQIKLWPKEEITQDNLNIKMIWPEYKKDKGYATASEKVKYILNRRILTP